MSVIIFYNKENQPIFKVKTDVYEKWDRETKIKQLKPYYGKGLKIVCHCCKGGRELTISSRGNQLGEKSFHLKRKSKTEKHHPNCCFYASDEGKKKEDNASFLKQPVKKEAKHSAKGQSSRSGQLKVQMTQEKFTFEEIIENLVSESVSFAYFSKKKQGEKATTQDLLAFIPLKTKQYQERSEIAYQMTGYAYVARPNFKEVTKSKEKLSELSKESNFLPFMIGRLENMRPLSKNGDFVLLMVSTTTKLVFKFSIKHSELSSFIDLESSKGDERKELWVAGLLESNAKNHLVQLTKPIFFVIDKEINPKNL